jgi:hypothetical protein
MTSKHCNLASSYHRPSFSFPIILVSHPLRSHAHKLSLRDDRVENELSKPLRKTAASWSRPSNGAPRKPKY